MSEIIDQLPACTLLGQDDQIISGFVPKGNIPIPLINGTRFVFQMVPQETVITKIRLRFATYCRINHCHITLEVHAQNVCKVSFSAKDLLDNQEIDIALPLAQSCVAQQPIKIILYSEDATSEHVVALWCSRKLPEFVHTLDFHLPLKHTTHNDIRVSIVIPVFNKALYTYNCLLTLLACDQEIGQEIIVVNNASTDETKTLLAHFEGRRLQCIDNKENNFFVQACRQGADIAIGEFILFLNNDTQVMPGWLSSMIRMMETDPKIGITGSKLIYPDGRLQEAGGIIFSDANGCNYGRLQDPSLPVFNQSREVDYCSGASLMIRKTLWEQLGGFDMRFSPAYYEDTDLCFAARQAGYRVMYCYESEVIHHEGITAGTDLTQGYKAYQVVNKEKFIQKWSAVLTQHHLPSHTPFDIAAQRLVCL